MNLHKIATNGGAGHRYVLTAADEEIGPLLAEGESVVVSIEAETFFGGSLTITDAVCFTIDESLPDFPLKELTRRFEARVIRVALKRAADNLSGAARLLGFKHHYSLSHLLKTRHKGLVGPNVFKRGNPQSKKAGKGGGRGGKK